MSFEKGTTALTIFRLPEKLPENALEMFEARAACKYQDTGAEEAIGWVSGRHLLERRIDEETAIRGGHYYLNLRITQRKVPPALLNAECRMLELEYMTENGVDFVPVKEKRSIKNNVEEKRLLQMPPQLVGMPFVIDRNTNHLYLGTASTKAVDTFLTFFYDTFSMTPIPVDFDDIMSRHFNETAQNLQCVTFSQDSNEPDFVPGRDFLTWLWYYSEQKGGKASIESGANFEIGIEGPLTLALMDEASGSGETVVKKGVPQNSAEAKAALSVGKKLKKAKLSICRGEHIWAGTIDTDTLSFSGLSLPDGEEMDIHSAFEERVNFLDMFRLALDAYVKTFIEHLKSPEWPAEQESIHTWSAERASL